MKRLLILLLIGWLLVSCSHLPQSSDQLTIITSLFPQYDFVREIAQDKVEVSLLLPPGVEPHSFDPSPSQIIAIGQSDLFIFTNHEMEPWIERVVENVGSSKLNVLESSQGINLLEDDHDHDHGHDPHVWLDPLNAKIMVKNIADALIKLDPENRQFYQDNADAYEAKLDDLNTLYESIFEQAQLDTIIYGGHFAFGYLMERFNITILSPYSGFSPDAEPTAKAISELIQTIKEKNIQIIFYEELIEPRVANIISEQTNTKAMLLHGAHNVTKEEMQAQVSYISIMEANAQKLKEALNHD